MWISPCLGFVKYQSFPLSGETRERKGKEGIAGFMTFVVEVAESYFLLKIDTSV